MLKAIKKVNSYNYHFLMKKYVLLISLLFSARLTFAQYDNWYLEFLEKNEKVYNGFDKKNKQGTCFVLQGGEINGRTFKVECYKNIRILDVSGCKIENYRDFISRLSKLNNLQYLNLSNQRPGTDTFNVEGLQFNQLKWLSIANCGFTVIDESIKNLKNLEYLNLGLTTGHFQLHNTINSLPPAFKYLSRLKKLVFGSNSLEYIPIEIFELKNLQSLNLQGNKIASAPIYIKQLINLSELSLDFNKLDSFPIVITELTELKNLNLSSNNIKTLPPQLCNLTKMESLSLSNNPVSLVSNFSCLHNLQSLSISNCKIDSVFTDNILPKNIHYLNLSNNGIIKLTNFNLPNLEKLILSGNKISQNDILLLKRDRHVVVIN